LYIEKESELIKGTRILLRRVKERDWQIIAGWGEQREALWGGFQRFQLDHLPLLRAAYEKTGLLSRDSAFLLIETLEGSEVVGFVRYTLSSFPDADLPQPEIGFGIPETSARGQGYAGEAVNLLVDYLFSGYPVERIWALTEMENEPARRVLGDNGFQREGVLRRSTFRDGAWRDLAIYALLRSEHQKKKVE
jgi:RimJ/RimL family protein N-acetyltransferase